MEDHLTGSGCTYHNEINLVAPARRRYHLPADSFPGGCYLSVLISGMYRTSVFLFSLLLFATWGNAAGHPVRRTHRRAPVRRSTAAVTAPRVIRVVQTK